MWYFTPCVGSTITRLFPFLYHWDYNMYLLHEYDVVDATTFPISEITRVMLSKLVL